MWVLIIRDVPCEVKPQPLGVYWGKPEKPMFKGELEKGWELTRPDNVVDLMRLYASTGTRRVNHFPSKDAAIYAMQMFQNGFADMIPPETRRELEIIDAEHGLPEIEYKLRIKTEGGEMCIWPHEYNPATPEKFGEYAAEIGSGYEVVQLGGSDDSEEFRQQLHYIRSRGVGISDALPMVFGEITKNDIFYLKPHPEIQRYFGFEPVAHQPAA